MISLEDYRNLPENLVMSVAVERAMYRAVGYAVDGVVDVSVRRAVSVAVYRAVCGAGDDAVWGTMFLAFEGGFR